MKEIREMKERIDNLIETTKCTEAGIISIKDDIAILKESNKKLEKSIEKMEQSMMRLEKIFERHLMEVV